MKIVTTLLCKSLWFFEMRNINPRGRNLQKIITPYLALWYKLSEPAADQDQGVLFQNGEFSPAQDGKDMTGVELKLYNNGIVASATTSTDDTDLFLDRTLKRLEAEGLVAYSPEIIVEKRYSSEVIAKADKTLMLFPELDAACRLMAELAYPSRSPRMQINRMSIDLGPEEPRRQVPLTLERKTDEPMDSNLYYSHGPLSTKNHLAVLEEIEKAFTLSE